MKTAIMHILLNIFLILLGSLIIWCTWHLVIPNVFPGLVKLEMISGKLTWAQSNCISLIYFSFFFLCKSFYHPLNKEE